LIYLRLAESLYTGNSNHPIQAIYQQRVHILMALGRFGDALHILDALPNETRENPSNATMRRLATLSIGGKLDEEGVSEEVRDEIISSAIMGLFDPSGENLLAFVLANPGTAQTLVNVTQEIIRRAQGGDGE
ncbi:MAG TPA: hypothetical protein VFY89_10000, partial [Ktedonobacterales bacterium]